MLFDLDGTLVDTAPDLVAVLNRLLREEGRPPVPYALARNVVSRGALGLLLHAYGGELGASEQARLRQRFLELYAERISDNSILFIQLDRLINLYSELDMLEAWGIVTNKPRALTRALLAALGIAELPRCVVSGDDLPERKPHPAPLLHAARQLGVAAAECVYIGDAPGDIVAGRAAGMRTVAAAYGYIRPAEDVRAWQADAILLRPDDLGDVLSELCR